jgi:hypothetical protein
MAFSDRSPAFTLTYGGFTGYATWGSTGTLYDSSLSVLRTFGVNGRGQADAIAEAGGGDVDWYAAAGPADVGDIEQDEGDDEDNLAFLQSDKWGYFHLVHPDAVVPTVIPSRKTGRLMAYRSLTYANDGTVTSSVAWGYFDVVYQDPHVVKLGEGNGTLLVLTRYRVLLEEASPSGGDWLDDGHESTAAKDHGPGKAIGDVVAYWSPHDDADFTTADCVGPLWLVDSRDCVDPALADGGTAQTIDENGDPVDASFPANSNFRVWCGVAAAVVQTDPSDGVEYLYVYYCVSAGEHEPDGTETGLYDAVDEGSVGYGVARIASRLLDRTRNSPTEAEPEPGDLVGFQGSLCVRRIRVEDLKERVSNWVLLWLQGEEGWELLGGLLPGDILGTCRIWRGEPGAGGVPLVEELPDASMADPNPRACCDDIRLYFLLSSRDDFYGYGTATAPEDRPYGVWATDSLPTGVASNGVAITFGRDFYLDPEAVAVIHSPVHEDEYDEFWGTNANWIERHADPDVIENESSISIFCAFAKKEFNFRGGDDYPEPSTRHDGEAGDACVCDEGPVLHDAPDVVNVGEPVPPGRRPRPTRVEIPEIARRRQIQPGLWLVAEEEADNAQ